MADPIEPNSADDKAAKIAEIQAKMAEAKARREAAAAAGEAPAGAAPPAQGAAAGAPADDKEAKLAELKAKMAAAKAKTAAGTASGAASPAAATASAATATATVAEPSPSDARIAAMRAKVAETRVTAPPRPASKPAASKPDSDVGVWFFGRRSFLQSVGWMSFFGFLTIVILGAVRAMFPRVIYERPPIFKAGFPGDYVPGTVSEKYKDEERVWIIRQTDGSFIALLAICTHLGCTPRWLTSENKFKCPCHGSGFRGNPSWGINFEGPAPRPLERIAIHLAPDGQIEIDKSKKFLWEKQQWDDPAATMKA